MVAKGSLETEEGEKIKVDFKFNPKEYSISKSNSWNASDANRGSNTPKLKFGGGQPKQMKLQLFFDTYEDGTNVRDYTDKLFKMMEINPNLPEERTEESTGAPPKLKLTWGTVWSFFCYLESLSVQYTLFLADGTPVRATADIGLKQAVDEKAQAATNPTSGGVGGEHVRQVQPRDRLDLIAFKEYGDAGQWRLIARANSIANPLNLRPGQRLVIPRRGA